MTNNRFLLILLLFTAVNAAETGKPFMTVYPSKEYGGHTQNWSLLQDDRGIMYIGDGYGVQEFDGSNWRTIINPNNSFAKSLAKDENGRIYVGSSGMLGYLEPDQHGQMQYRSLMEFINPEDRQFNYVWSVLATPAGIYFQTHERLFRFHPEDSSSKAGKWQVDVWRPQHTFGYTFWIDETLYVQQYDAGLMKMVNDSLVLLPGGEQFANDRIQVFLPYPGKPGSYLIGTFIRGLFLWDGNRFQPFPTAADALLKEGTLYTGIITPDSCFALGTMANGLVIIDTDGRIKHHINQDAGLLSNTMSCLFVDKQRNLWVGMDGGVAILEYNSPLSEFHIPGGTGPSELRRHQGILYNAANDGVYYLDETDGNFKLVGGIEGNAQSFYFHEINNELFVTVNQGVFRIKGKTAAPSLPNLEVSRPVLIMSDLSLARHTIIAGTSAGVDLLQYSARDPARLSRIGRIDGVHEYIRLVAEEAPGVIWLGTMDAGIIRLTFNANDLLHPIIDKFGQEHGLPAGGVIGFKLADRLTFCTEKGTYAFDPARQLFSHDPFFDAVHLGRNPAEGIIIEDRKGNLWVNLGRESAVYIKRPDGGYRLEKDQLARFAKEVINTIYPEKDGVIWFGTANNVIRFAPDQRQVEQADFPALIRCVALAGDSVVYHGAAIPGSHLADPAGRSFPFRFNSIRFDFSASSYLNPRANEFRSRLEGFDEGWSPWATDTRRNYTNLPAGKYRFRVQARNIFQHESSEDLYAFTIKPPFYGTKWAWCFYILSAVALILGLVRVRTRQLQERSRVLEKVVLERTAEIATAQEKLVTQSKLAALGALTAGIAHEIKNPLNFVNNFAELIGELVAELRETLTGQLDRMEPAKKTETVEILDTLQQNAAKIMEHGRRADNIVKSMLQHSRGKAGERQLTDINAMLAEDINLAYHGMRAQDSSFNIKIETDFDPAIGKMEVVPQDVSRVFLNLISNGCYEVHRKKLEQNGDFAPLLSVSTRNLEKAVEIRIRDNGNGIPAAIREKLFTPFFTTKPTGKGTGLGLSISYDIIVQQHGGQLTFETKEGAFAEFIIRLPK